jgi:hypothetical protein
MARKVKILKWTLKMAEHCPKPHSRVHMDPCNLLEGTQIIRRKGQEEAVEKLVNGKKQGTNEKRGK